MRETASDQQESDFARDSEKRKACSLGLEEMIAERIKQLPEFQRRVLAIHFAEGLRLDEVAEVFGVCRSRVYRAYAQAIQAVLPASEAEI